MDNVTDKWRLYRAEAMRNQCVRILLHMVFLLAGLTASLQVPVARAEAFYTITNAGIFSVDTLDGGPPVQLLAFAQTLAATLAVRPSDGMLFWLDSTGANPGLWRWDPANPTLPAVFVGTPGATTTGVIRLAFDAAGTLYAMNPGPSTLWTLDPNTGGILTATTASGAVVPAGGDICLHPATGVLYMVAQTQLFTIDSSAVVTLLGNVTFSPALPATPSMTGCAFDRNGRLVVSPATSASLHAINISTLVATPLAVSTGFTAGAMGDLATAPGRVSDLRLTKTASNLTPGNTVSFTLTVTNNGPDRATDVRVRDVLPAGLTFVSATASQGTYSTAAVGAFPAGTWRIGTMNNGATATLTINVSVTGATAITNMAQISHSDQFDPDSTPNNSVASEDDQASVVIVPSPDLQITKVAVGTFTVGTNSTYRISVNNLLGSAATSAAYTVTDTMVPSLTIVGTPSGPGWNCSASTSTQLSCTSSTAIAAGGTNPGLITLTVLPSAAASPSVTNVATVAGGGEPASNSGNNSSGVITTAVCAGSCPDLVVNKTLSVASLTVGVNTSVYTLSVTNTGGLTTGTSTYTITDNLPAGLTLAAAPTAGPGWTCTPNAGALENVVNGTKVICSRSTAVVPGGTSSTITFTVIVGNAAAPSVTNTASVSGGGEPTSATGNNSTSLVTPVIDFDLQTSKTKTTAGNFNLGVTTDTYTIVINNIGGRNSTGTYTVTDVLPTGLTLTTAGGGAGWAIGTGWTCAANTPAAGDNVAGGSRVVCTRSTSINSGAASTSIVFPVTVAVAAVPSVSNTATVSNPNESANLLTNNSSTVVTSVNAPDLMVSKSHTGNFTVGQTGTYTITAFNNGAQATTTATVTVTDTLPAGLVYTSTSGNATGTNWTCAAAPVSPATTQTVTCTTTSRAANTAYPPITLPVTATTAGTLTNNVSIAGGGEPAVNNGNNTDSDVTQVFVTPTVSKAFSPASVQAGVTSQLTITINNPATFAITGVAVVDPFPAGMSVTATPAFVTTNCGTFTVISGNTQGDTLVSLTGGTIPASSSCTIQVNVSSTTVGANVNIVDNVSTTNSGTGTQAAAARTATVTVTAPGSPVLSKLTAPDPVGVNQLATMTFTINNKTTATTDMGFTDNFPAGVVYRGTTSMSCTSTGGTAFSLTEQTGAANVAGAALVAGTSTGIKALGIDLVGSASCTIVITVSSATPGSYLNSSTAPTAATSNIPSGSLQGGLTAPGINDTLVVVGTTLTKTFSPSTVVIGQSSNLTFAITNGAGAPQQGGLAFTETLPANVVVASAPSATQCGGTVTAPVGLGTITFSGGAMASGLAVCNIVVPVRSGLAGTYNNTPANVTGVSAGMTNSANATLTVNSGVALNFAKSLRTVCDPQNFAGNGTTIFPKAIPGAYVQYTLTISNGAGAVNSANLTTIIDALDPNLSFDVDLRTGTPTTCATSPPENAGGRGFVLTCMGGTRNCTTPIYFASASGDDAMGISGSSITLTFGDSPGAPKALPTETGYGPGELEPGESITIRFNTIVK